MTQDPFYSRDSDRFVPTRAAAGPWDPNSLHGRVIVGLLGAQIEAAHGGPDYMPARLTVDMYRLPSLAPVTVSTRLVRDGWRIKVAEAEFFSDGVSMARASCQLLRRTQAPDGEVWSPPPWSAPSPDEINPPKDPRMTLNGMWDLLPIVGGMGDRGPRQIWMREVRELVGGEALTPFARVALAADFASPFANAGTNGLEYINSDVTLYLHRLPTTNWVGMEVVDHGSSDGVGFGECRLHDEAGPIGAASVAALVQGKKRLGPASPG